MKARQIIKKVTKKVKRIISPELTKVERELKFKEELEALMAKYQVSLHISIVGIESQTLPVIEA